ncbi:MAG: cytochrome c3 family protein [Kofleriaceae bacterium]
MRILIVIALLVVATPAHAQLLSPGPLSQAHASIDTDNDCGRCHESGKQVVARLCFDCHKDLKAEIDNNRGLHGKQYKGQACETCHVEHVGKNAKLIRWPGGTADKLDHSLTGWPLTEGHAKVTPCSKCHTKVSPLGKPQFIATSAQCSSCHKDPHAGKFGVDCAKCHDQTDFKAFRQKSFDHALAAFQLTGKHAAVACEKCHKGSPPTWKPVAFSTCESCHQDPHAGQFKPKPCTGCHDTNSWEAAADAIKANHPKLSLANGHAKVACKTCHDRGNDKPPTKGSKCESCHHPIHLAKFGDRCETCHASIKWVGLPETVGRAAHDKTRYPLVAKHVAVACAKCHPATKPQAQRFKNLSFAACATCHADPHKGEFSSRNKGECAQCHEVSGFAPTSFDLAAHASTSFPLDGKHVATPCKSCHKNPPPRMVWTVASKQCADCHANPHGAQFATEMAQGGCAKCHTTVDWHQPHIDHSSWPLLGAHAQTACAACHGEQKQGAQPAAYRGIPRDCEGCHDDIHAGQFLQTSPRKSCATCHQPTSFQIAKTFDHKTTQYPLDGKHVGVACAKCHPQTTLRNGSTAVRWRLGYTQCRDCHANPHREKP